MAKLALGSHVSTENPIETAEKLGLDHIQIFLADPQSWKGNDFPHPDGAEGLRVQAEKAKIGIYVHARYIINVATSNNKVRIPSRKILQADVDAAALVGAKGVIVHGGHVTADDDPELGVANWVKAINQLDMKVPVFIENTAGGKFSMARRLESIARLWDAVGQTGVGFCLDTCHAHAGGIAQETLSETILKTTGRIDLVHCNNSRDVFDSGADRHANLDSGTMDLEILINNLKVANAPIVLETPYENIEADLKILRDAKL
jgi:deoxyribonuclease IV